MLQTDVKDQALTLYILPAAIHALIVTLPDLLIIATFSLNLLKAFISLLLLHLLITKV